MRTYLKLIIFLGSSGIRGVNGISGKGLASPNPYMCGFPQKILKTLFLLFILLLVAGCTTKQVVSTAEPEVAAPAALQPADADGVTVAVRQETPEAVVDWTAAATAEPTAVVDTAVAENPQIVTDTLQILVADEQLCTRVADLNDNYTESINIVCAHNMQSFDEVVNSYDFIESDLYVFPNEWILQAAQAQNLVDLTHFLQVIDQDEAYLPNVMNAYEYPSGSGQRFGVPLHTDMQILVYRQDLMDSANLQPAQSWEALLAQAEQLQAENDGLAGLVTAWCDSVACAESITAVWQQIARSHHTKLWDEASGQIVNVLDNSENQAVVAQLQALYNTNPNNAAQQSAPDALQAICDGNAGIALVWASEAQAFLRDVPCAQQASLSFAPLPSAVENGILLNSTGVSINANSNKQEQAMAYLAWIHSFESQAPWVMLGGLPVHQQIIQDDAFLYASPVAPTFAASLQNAQASSEPIALSHALNLQALTLRQAIIGELSAQEGLTQIATQVQLVLDEAYIE